MMAVHAVSATAVMVNGERHQLAMCGEDLGTYEEATAVHLVANYMGRRWADHGVTCPGCLVREVQG